MKLLLDGEIARFIRIAPAADLELAVVIPTFNERANVPLLVEKLDAALQGRNWEAVFVDDDSPDGTADAARALGRRDPR
ncbi:glycosyltransferase, partial [Escherichia coli]|nr:glycosyltransferase [Escherichia coli]